ncbi:MAG: glucosyl-3-phosphoglycerate synthase [Solirubrobacterales bacterium]|nr:glucosyl-3-phosphoglycerate synthase [Solirubrobacterales bacterium]
MATVRTLAHARAPQRRAIDAGVADWYARRRYRAGQFDLDRLRAAKAGIGVTVIIPTKDCGATIAEVIGRTVAPLADRGLVDALVVVDAASEDGTAERAAAAGARALQQDELCPELGPAAGKGDAMWRALQVTGGEVVCFLDGDTIDPRPEHLQGLLGPLLTDDWLHLVKGAFERPMDTGRVTLPHEGGRVTELMARPLLNYHVPALAGFAQPLAGEFSARRELLEEIAFPVGYGVEIAVLIEAYRRRGLDALAECHLGTRQNRHQPLRALGEMAYAVLAAVQVRLSGVQPHADAIGRYVRPWEDAAIATVAVGERPPIGAGRADAAPAEAV